MKTFEQLQSEYNASINAMNEAKKELYSFEDGFEYIVVKDCYGNVSEGSYTNSFAALEETKGYNGVNGSTYLYTNNPSLRDNYLDDGEVVFLFQPSDYRNGIREYSDEEYDHKDYLDEDEYYEYVVKEQEIAALFLANNVFVCNDFDKVHNYPDLWKEEYFFGENEAFRTIWKNRLSA